MRRRREAKKVSNIEETLKKFRRHSRSPGVGELLNERVKQRYLSEKRRRRRFANSEKNLPNVLYRRTPMLGAIKYGKLHTKVQKKPVIVEEKKHTRKFEDILGLAYSKPVGQNEICVCNSDSSSDSSSEDEEYESENRPGDHSPAISCTLTSADEDDATSGLTVASGSLEKPRWSASWKRLVEDARYLSSGLDSTDVLKHDPFLTTMADHANSLKSTLERQDVSESSPKLKSDDCDERFALATSPASVVDKLRKNFVVGAEAIASHEKVPDHPILYHGRSTDLHASITPPWFSEDRQFSSVTKEHGHAAFAMDSSHHRCGEAFQRRFAANMTIHTNLDKEFSHRCSPANPFFGCMSDDMDFLEDQLPEQYSTECGERRSRSSDSLDELTPSTSNMDIPPLESRSPGPEDFARLTARTFAFVTEGKAATPNFFGVPRRIM